MVGIFVLLWEALKGQGQVHSFAVATSQIVAPADGSMLERQTSGACCSF